MSDVCHSNSAKMFASFQVLPVLQLLHSDAVTVPFSGRMWVLIWGLDLNLALTKLATIFDFRPDFSSPGFFTSGDLRRRLLVVLKTCWPRTSPSRFFHGDADCHGCRAKVDETQDHCGKRHGKLWWKLCRNFCGIHRIPFYHHYPLVMTNIAMV